MPEIDQSQPRTHQPEDFADTALPEYYIRYVGLGARTEDHGYVTVQALPALGSTVEIKLPFHTLQAQVLFIEPEFTSIGPKEQHYKVHVNNGVIV